MKKIFFLVFVFSKIGIGMIFSQDLPDPYNSLSNVLPFDGHHWFVNPIPLKNVLSEKPAYTVIEIGSWLGESTRFIANNLSDKKGLVYAVDHWKGPLPSMGYEELGAYEEQKHRLPTLYEQFLSNIIHAGLCNTIIPIRMESLEAARQLDVIADVIYIDAAHDTESVYSDIMHWLPHVSIDRGVICGDDWSWASVRKAVEKAAVDLHMEIYTEGNFWRLK